MVKTDSQLAVTIYNVEPFRLLLGEHDERLCLCSWIGGKAHESTLVRLAKRLGAGFDIDCSSRFQTPAGQAAISCPSPLLAEAVSQLDAYFSRRLTGFDLPLEMSGTDFQCQVWSALRAIPYGTTVSYADVARMIGRPTAVRAVANANGANPVSIFVPCHRVIGSDSSLTGYGGGLDAKRMLLELEGAI